ncbi:MAG TPA: prohibitin family protein [Acidobacteriota bacterium]|nr:prohibitin family protein [Acidobacteriota bacterium]HQM62141.1 prohibitin family protein [Acidobacteriota bacterium]
MFFLGLLIAIVAVVALRVVGRQGGVPRLAAIGALVLGVLLMLFQAVTVVPAGHVGVVDFFGSVSPTPLRAGINLVNPLANVLVFSVKTQEMKEVLDVPSQEGLTVQLEVSVLYHLNMEKAPEVYRTVGPDYVRVLLEPQVRSVARGVTAGYEARALYTSERETLSRLIAEEISHSVGPRGVVIESAPLRRVGLPPGLTQAIEEKLRAEQESQRMKFVLEKEKLEAERKRIEAQGISDFQNIVSKGISEQLLQWKGIEATEKLAQSANSKVVVIGSGKNGLPLILNSD